MAKLLRRAQAGTLESSDVFVTLEPCGQGLEIDIDSVVIKQFGEEILRVVKDELTRQDVTDAKVSIVDRGALECVLRARVETAVLRAKEE